MTDPEGLIALGWASAATGHPDEAKKVAERLATATVWQALELRGWILATSGNPVAGERLIRDAQIPDHVLHGYRLGMVLFMQGQARWNEARPLLEGAKDIGGRASLFAGAKAQVASVLATIEAQAAPAPAKPVSEPAAPVAPAVPEAAPATESAPAAPAPVGEVPVVEPQTLPATTP